MTDLSELAGMLGDVEYEPRQVPKLNYDDFISRLDETICSVDGLLKKNKYQEATDVINDFYMNYSSLLNGGYINDDGIQIRNCHLKMLNAKSKQGHVEDKKRSFFGMLYESADFDSVTQLSMEVTSMLGSLEMTLPNLLQEIGQLEPCSEREGVYKTGIYKGTEDILNRVKSSKNFVDYTIPMSFNSWS
ncbi:MAG: hypothetical protein ACQESF_03620 [Nanobdellota archaeon]